MSCSFFFFFCLPALAETDVERGSFFPVFASPNPDLVDVAYIADEIEYIANKTSKDQ